jgi:single-stranded-DNA-specific exonuclease
MAQAEDVVHLFLTEDVDRARSLAAQLHALNHERQQTEAEIVRLALEECEKFPVTDDQSALVFAGKNWHRGVVGIVASRLVERFCRPVFVLSEEDDVAQGSGRSIVPFHLLEALESMPDLFTRFGGHRGAAGVSLSASRVTEFRDRFNAFASTRLTPADFRPQLAVDATVELRELTEDAIAEILSLAPFGFGNPPPLLAVEGAEIAASVVVKEKHLRLQLRQNRRSIFAKAWNFAERAPETTAGGRVDAAFSIEEDSYAQSRGWGNWGAILKDVRPSSNGG